VLQGGNTSESYSYDAVGNRLSSLGVSPYSYNSSNELTSTPSVTYTYDNNGSTLTKVTSSGTTRYNWDFENRLASVVLPASGGTVSFKYDPFGRRIQKASSSATTNYVYDGANVLEEVDGSGNVLARYVQSPAVDQPLAEVRGSTTGYYEADGLGSITSLSNSSAALGNIYTYDSYGNLTASSGTVVNPYRYTGREFDTETGIYYYRARYYNPTTGRFLSEDPIRFEGGIDFYTYVSNSPLNDIDPSGFCESRAECVERAAQKRRERLERSRAEHDARTKELLMDFTSWSVFLHGAEGFFSEVIAQELGKKAIKTVADRTVPVIEAAHLLKTEYGGFQNALDAAREEWEADAEFNADLEKCPSQ
jgi:RHS repeat-associated protein